VFGKTNMTGFEEKNFNGNLRKFGHKKFSSGSGYSKIPGSGSGFSDYGQNTA
jgi:hypothetical protein